MATWGQAFGKTLLQMAPDVQKKMQTNFEDKRNAGAMREIARIALMTDPAQQQAAITELMQRPDTPREIMPYLPKIAEASSAGVRGQRATAAVAKGVGFQGETAGLDAQTILAMQQYNLSRDRALAAEKAGEITRAREEATWSQRQEAQKWLNSEDGRRTAELASSTVRDDRTGSVVPAPGASAAQILYTQKWHEAGYTGNPPFQEPHYFAPQSGGGTRDTTTAKLVAWLKAKNDVYENLGMTDEQKAAALAEIDRAFGMTTPPPPEDTPESTYEKVLSSQGGDVEKAITILDRIAADPSANAQQKQNAKRAAMIGRGVIGTRIRQGSGARTRQTLPPPSAEESELLAAEAELKAILNSRPSVSLSDLSGVTDANTPAYRNWVQRVEVARRKVAQLKEKKRLADINRRFGSQ